MLDTEDNTVNSSPQPPGSFPHATRVAAHGKQAAPFSRLLQHARGCWGRILPQRPHGGNMWTEINEDRNVLYKVCVLGRSEKQDVCPGFWLAETISTFSPKRLNEIQRNLTGSKVSKYFGAHYVAFRAFWLFFFFVFGISWQIIIIKLFRSNSRFLWYSFIFNFVITHEIITF